MKVVRTASQSRASRVWNLPGVLVIVFLASLSMAAPALHHHADLRTADGWTADSEPLAAERLCSLCQSFHSVAPGREDVFAPSTNQRILPLPELQVPAAPWSRTLGARAPPASSAFRVVVHTL